MAAPAFAVSGTFLSGDTGTAVNVAVPSGVVNGSVIGVAMFLDSSATVTALPSGFAHAEGSPVQLPAGGGQHSFVLVWKRATGADSGTYDFTISSAVYREAQAHRYTDVVASGTPFDSPTSSATDTANGTVTPAVSIDTAGSDRLLIHGGTNWSGGTWTAPSGFTKRMDAGFGVVTLSDKAQAAQGSSGSVTATCTGSDKRSAWLGALIGTTSETPQVPVYPVSQYGSFH